MLSFSVLCGGRYESNVCGVQDILPVLKDALQPLNFKSLLSKTFPRSSIRMDDVAKTINLIQAALTDQPSQRPSASLLHQHALWCKETSKLMAVDTIWHSNLKETENSRCFTPSSNLIHHALLYSACVDDSNDVAADKPTVSEELTAGDDVGENINEIVLKSPTLEFLPVLGSMEKTSLSNKTSESVEEIMGNSNKETEPKSSIQLNKFKDAFTINKERGRCHNNEKDHSSKLLSQITPALEESLHEEKIPTKNIPEEYLPLKNITEECSLEENVSEESLPTETLPEESLPVESLTGEKIPEERLLEESLCEECLIKHEKDRSKYIVKRWKSFKGWWIKKVWKQNSK